MTLSIDYQGHQASEFKLFLDIQIKQHLYWKNKVELLFSNPAKDHVLPNLLSDDKHCELGHWIESIESNDLSNLDAFRSIKKFHTEFHDLSGKIMLLIMNGEAQKAAKHKERFDLLSNEILNCLNQLNKVKQ